MKVYMCLHVCFYVTLKSGIMIKQYKVTRQRLCNLLSKLTWPTVDLTGLWFLFRHPISDHFVKLQDIAAIATSL